MADVQIQQTPGRGGSNWAWAIIIIILLVVIGWFLFGGGLRTGSRSTTEIHLQAPAAGGTSGGTAGAAPTGGTAPAGGTGGAATTPRP